MNNLDDSLIEKTLKAYPGYFNEFLSNPETYRIQIIYTQIDRQADNTPLFKDHFYRTEQNEYFYPASTIKFPTALLALQRLNEMNIEGFDKTARMIHGADYSGQLATFNDPTSKDGASSIEHYIKKILLVSDNDAFNRLYEFLGSRYINENLHKMGYPEAQIIHRLERSLTEDQNRHTNPVDFFNKDGKLLFNKPMEYDSASREIRKDFLGHAYMKGNIKVEGPMDFSNKNRLSLAALHSMVRAVLFPSSLPRNKQFGLKKDDYSFIRKYMSMFPPESGIAGYDSISSWDAYCKFLLWGSEKGEKPANIRIFNKVGDAYGFLIDAAYIVDFEKKVEFMLSAVIYCNKDGVLNDSKYDYDEIGFPFMKNLGRVFYQYELERKRKWKPDLKEFQYSYQNK